jgi:anaerobic magnesium-protoporphyrin IX monomethyl ester cyclase
MNYLLVMPKKLSSIDHFNIFPIGLAYISASLKKGGHHVFTANLDFIEGDTQSILKKLISSQHIDVLCTGGLSRDCDKLKKVIETARKINPDIITVVGGGIISADPEIAMRVLDADIGVIGEGEVTICELARALDNGHNYDHVAGLIYKDGNNAIIKTLPRKEIADIDSIPFPDFDGFNYAEWVRTSGGGGTVLSDRSCPFHCTFCFHPTGEKYRQRSLENIFQEIDYQIHHYGVNTIGLTSELFSTTRQRVVDFCHRIKEYKIPWSCCLRVCDVDAEMLHLMKKSGCVNVVFGLESADNSVLKSMRKAITVEQIERALSLTYEASLMIEAGFIFGDINETKESVENTLNFWRKHNKMHYLNLTMIYVFPGSHLYKYACSVGIIKDREKFLRDGCPLINVSKLTDIEYKALTSRITELRLHPHVPAGTLKTKEIQPNGECKMESLCRKCGNQIHSNVPFWFGKEEICPSCSLINFIDPFRNCLNSQEDFFACLPNDGVVALWGAGGIYYKLMQKYNMLSSNRFLLVDANPLKQGLTICGKEIHSPATICEINIKTVIITALSKNSEIHASLCSNYPSVKHILIPSLDINGDMIVPFLKNYKYRAAVMTND